MSKRTRRYHSAEQKAEAPRRHHVKKEEVSSICEDLKLNPSVFYHWQRNLFANATLAVEGGAGNGKKSAREQELEKKVAALDSTCAKFHDGSRRPTCGVPAPCAAGGCAA